MEKVYSCLVVLTESVMTVSAIVELFGDTRTISKETGSVSTDFHSMVLLSLRSSLAPSSGLVIEMARENLVLAGQPLTIPSFCQSVALT